MNVTFQSIAQGARRIGGLRAATRCILAVSRAAAFAAMLCATAANGQDARSARTLWDDFADPPDAAKPWVYYLWQNGLADRETITADLEAMKSLGFGGINQLDTRGYWDDEEHVVIPKAEIVWGSPEWYDLVVS